MADNINSKIQKKFTVMTLFIAIKSNETISYLYIPLACQRFWDTARCRKLGRAHPMAMHSGQPIPRSFVSAGCQQCIPEPRTSLVLPSLSLLLILLTSRHTSIMACNPKGTNKPPAKAPSAGSSKDQEIIRPELEKRVLGLWTMTTSHDSPPLMVCSLSHPHPLPGG